MLQKRRTVSNNRCIMNPINILHDTIAHLKKKLAVERVYTVAMGIVVISVIVLQYLAILKLKDTVLELKGVVGSKEMTIVKLEQKLNNFEYVNERIIRVIQKEKKSISPEMASYIATEIHKAGL